MEENTPTTFKGFAWPVPTAFASGLNQCRFERGDVFYASPKGYLIWEEALKNITYSLQVRFPARATGKVSAEGNVFAENWLSPVGFTVTNYKKNQTREATSTQGRLYTLLWLGDWMVLDAPIEPQIPLTCQDRVFLKEADNVAKQIKSRCCSPMSKPNLFVMPYDPTHPITSAKYETLKRRLARDFTVVEEEFTPRDVGLGQLFLVPTIRYVAFMVDSKNSQGIAKALKEALYSPTRNRITKQDRFKIEAHGSFLPFQSVDFNEESPTNGN